MIKLSHIQDAQDNIKEFVIKTPVINFNRDIYLKLENKQPVVKGFKIRGVANYIKHVDKNSKKIITSALGTHGFAVGYIGKQFGIPTMCIMPEDSPNSAVQKMKLLVDEVVFMKKDFVNTELAAYEYAKKNNFPFLHPYSDEHMIAGHGTIGLELLEELDTIDNIYVPVGGGGLISGIAIAIKLINPSINIIGVQPQIMHAMESSKQKGSIIMVENKKSIADKLVVNLDPNTMTFKYVEKYVDRFVLPNENEIKEAMRLLYNNVGEKIEGSGAITLAAALKDKNRKGISVCIVSGGNIDNNILEKIISE